MTTPEAAADPQTGPAIEALNLHRRFNGNPAVDGVSLLVAPGEFLALLGASGSGKTTTLRLLAGFERPDEGVLRLWGETVAGEGQFVPPERRRVGMVFQDYALFPHMNVAQNVAYGLPREGRQERVEAALELTGLAGFGQRSVHDLSGGEQQRVALARALAPEPRLLLLDEPFSNLDTQLRSQVRAEVSQIVRRTGVTAVLVTHDQEEALSIADRVAFMWRGRIEQVGTPDEIYRHPATLRVASSIGDANVLHYPVRAGRVETPFGAYEAPADAARCALVLRPEDVEPAREGAPARVLAREYYGHDQVVHLAIRDAAGEAALRVRLGPYDRLTPGDEVRLRLRREPLVFAEGE